MDDLFDVRPGGPGSPLAERMRPTRLDEIAGQKHLIGEGKLLRRLIAADRLPSMILWGPPGTGKTTLAGVIAKTTGARFVSYSAVNGSLKEVRELVEEARRLKGERNKRTILFVDEIHRFNKAQQDAFLPAVERGIITLIGATTENPSFEVNPALLSRCRVLVLKSLEPGDIVELLRRALVRELGGKAASEEALRFLAEGSQGDARRALSALEVASDLSEDGPIDQGAAEAAFGRKLPRYDKSGEAHYDTISAFIKSMRGSDPDAAVYYLARQLEGGEDPLFLCRRMIIFAAEDIGNADPMALVVATQAFQAVHAVGLPEGRIPMAMAATYLASASKSKAAYYAIEDARAEVERTGALEVPMHLRNAPTKLMKGIGYGAGYRDPHAEGGFASGVSYLPDILAGTRFYQPTAHGHEARIQKRLAWLRGEPLPGNEPAAQAPSTTTETANLTSPTSPEPNPPQEKNAEAPPARNALDGVTVEAH
jgi:putative ATPase